MKELLEKYSDKFGYIQDFYDLIMHLEKDGKTQEEINRILLKINNDNVNIYNKIYKENETLKKINNVVKEEKINNTNKKEIKEINSSINDEKKSDNNNDNNQIDHYKYQITELLNKNYSYQELTIILDSIPESKLFEILVLLQLNYIKDLKIVKEMLKDNDDELWNLTVKEEIDNLNLLINDIKKYKNSLNKNEILSNDKNLNILFDLETIDQDLSNIDINQYYDLLALFEGLKKGKFKNQKTFTPIGINKAVQEVRNAHVRIIYDKVDNDTYIAYYIFPKKDTDKAYHEKLVSRCKSFFNKKNYILKDYFESTTKEIYLNKNEEKLDEVIKVLSKRKDVK